MKKENIKERKQITGSEAVMLSLINEGVDAMFGYPGGQIMPVFDALFDYQDKLNHILTRHEQGAIHAAQGYARVTGKVGVVLVTSGPGATNLVTGIADAMIDSTPLVCITGQVGTHLLGSDAFQESDVVGITMPVTKWSFQITSPEEVATVFAKAFYIASTGRPGPVVIDITRNAQVGKVNFKYEKCKSVRSYLPYPKPDLKQIDEAANIIYKAKKPLVIFGQGVILGRAEAELKIFLEKSGIPAAWTILGLSALPSDHPLNMGMLGMHGNYAPNIKTNECDVLIAIGLRFDDRITGDINRYAKQAKIIHMEIDPAEVDKNVKVNVHVSGDVKATLPMLTKKIKKATHTAWIKGFKDAYKIEYEKVIKKSLYATQDGITMGEVIRRLTEATKGEAIVVTDVGQNQMAAVRYFKFKQSRSLVTSGGLGTMGFGLPASIGAKIGAPKRTVICIVGDGGLQMTIQELGTILQSKVGVKIVLLNNRFLGMVRQWQELFWQKRYSSTEMINPDFMKIAEAYSIKSEKVEERKKLDKAIQTMLKTEGAYLLEVKIEKEDNVFPMVPTGASVSEVLFGK